ncbi:MAG TPA: DEAD/DEAH box helicase [Streptosporangiaceae bacterium]|nr:DEAD/DEAH box helicase [Streptosporangiaceae bacterium]
MPDAPDEARDTSDLGADQQAQPGEPTKTFRDLGVAEPICAALEDAGITTAFPIQALALPIALDGQDLIGQARTGTGKTLAFGVPLLQRLAASAPAGKSSAPRALIVVPTRELAIQVADDLRIAGSRLGTHVVTLYGGRAYEPQIEALANVDLVVGTPGRLLDLARQGHLDLSQLDGLVLDEADKMLDLGFLPDVEKILRLTPPARQTMLFSATMPGEVVTLARRHLRRPTHVRAEHSDELALVPSTEQHVFRAHQMDKIEVLARVLQAEGRGLTIVFCRTKRAADQVATALTTRGFAAAAVHGDLGQGQRERAMRAFRSGKVDVLVATDVAARGLDVDDVTHVVNYECPEDDKAYLHRTGRTGRAGRTGVAVTFVDWADLQRWKIINETLGLGQPEPEETYSTSEHLYGALRIPEGITGTLPRAKRDRLGLEAEDLEDIGETGNKRSQTGRGGDHGARTRSRQDDSGHGHETGQRKRRVRRRTRAGLAVSDNGEARETAVTATAAADTDADESRPAKRRRRPSRRRGRGAGAGAGAGQVGAAGKAPEAGQTEQQGGER